MPRGIANHNIKATEWQIQNSGVRQQADVARTTFIGFLSGYALREYLTLVVGQRKSVRHDENAEVLLIARATMQKIR
ncbi:hypothetical protein D3C80_1474700 [compost metagenome]